MKNNKLRLNINKSVKRFDDNKSLSNRYYCASKNFEISNFINKLFQSVSSSEITKDAECLMHFLSPKMTMQRRSENTYSEKFVTDPLEFITNNFPDVIFIPGNNDLSQIDDLLQKLHQLKHQLIEKGMCHTFEEAEKKIASISIVISGKGGHGVTLNPIFATTEAEAFAHYLRHGLHYQTSISNPVFIEKEATNSGANVDLSKKFMREIAKKNHKELNGLTVWLVPTLLSCTRQLLITTKQSPQDTKTGGSGFHLNQVYVLPDKAYIFENYFNPNNEQNMGVNFYAALRETVNFISYILNNDFMSGNIPDRNALEQAINVTFKYYDMLNHTEIKNKENIVKNIIDLAVSKEKKGSITLFDEDDINRVNEIKKYYGDVINYFQNAFVQVERQHMRFLGNTLTIKNPLKPSFFELKKQENFSLQKQSLFSKYHLIDSDSVHFPCKPKMNK